MEPFIKVLPLETLSADIVVAAFRDGTDQVIQQFTDKLAEWCESARRDFAIILDYSDVGTLTPSQRLIYAGARERLRDAFAKHHILTVYVVTTALQRGFITAVSWSASPGEGSGKVFTSTVGQARVICEEALRNRRPQPQDS